MASCQFLARYHHSDGNLKTLANRYTNQLSYARLVELTKGSDFNDYYGSEYADLP